MHSFNDKEAQALIHQLSIAQSADESRQLRIQLELLVNDLLLHDFSGLVHLLYRVDVNEKKLREVLAEQLQTDAAVLISSLILNRLEEKRRSREAFRRTDNIDDNDRW